MFWRIRWYFAIFIGGMCLLSAVAGIIGFLITKNWYLLGIVPSQSILLTAMFYLVPMDERRYQLRALKIQSKAQIKAQKVQAKAQKQATKQHN